MKSRTSFFNATVFKKNLTRFAPAWGLYTVFLVLAVLTNTSNMERAGTMLLRLADSQSAFLFFYAPVCTQLLFGDLLYNTRMCNALHALPLKRESWFFTNMASGFAFFLIPVVTATALEGLLMYAGGYPGSMAVIPLCLLQMTLAFACFFGISTFASFFAGNRLAHVVVYGLLCFGSMILHGLVDTLYVSMYYGVETNQDAFMLFCPMARMTEGSFLEVEGRTVTDPQGFQKSVDTAILHMGDSFTYYFIAAAVGIGLILAGLWLYRRRKLESAGDFLAIRALEPVFSVIYTLAVGTFFHLISGGLYLIVGLIVGWFTGRMLLERTVRVFRKKNILRGAAVIGIFLLSLAVAYFDPLGIEAWVPEAHKVASVTISDGNAYLSNYAVTLETPQAIERVLTLHQSALDEHWEGYPHEQTYEDAYKELIEQTVVPDEMDRYMSHTITYHLKDGRTVSRHYRIWMGDEDGRFLSEVFSSSKALFGYDEDLPRFLEENKQIRIRDTWQGYDTILRSETDIAELYQAILADAQNGKLVQKYSYHRNEQEVFWIFLEDRTQLTIYSGCNYTLDWLRAQGVNVDEVLRELRK